METWKSDNSIYVVLVKTNKDGTFEIDFWQPNFASSSNGMCKVFKQLLQYL